MKNIYLIFLGLIGLFIVSCNPMQDINDEIDDINDQNYIRDTFIYNREVAPQTYTLTDEDYELSSNESVANYKNFSESALPKDYLPEILNKKFVASNAAEMIVTYDYYSRPVTDDENAYVIDTAEYLEMGQSYPNFSDEDAAEYLIGKMLDRKVYNTDAGTEMTVLYNLFSSGETRYITVISDDSTTVLDYAPDEFYTLDSADYEALDEGYYNFYTIDVAQNQLITLAELNGDVLPQTYECKVYLNYFDTYVVFMHDGNNWMAKQSVMAVSEPLNYDLNSEDITLSTWWADPAIKITFGQADYDIFTETANYQNFDLRSGQTPGTDRGKLVEMVGAMLDANHNAVDDQQYLVTYAYYDGGSGIGSIRVIRTAGVWSEFSE